MKHYCEPIDAVLAEYLIAIGLGALVVPIVEIVKWFQRKSAK